jgi:hypothetical protein
MLWAKTVEPVFVYMKVRSFLFRRCGVRLIAARSHHSMLLVLYLGSHMICQYALFSFGIRSDQWPMSFDGELKREKFLVWIRDREVIEQAVVVPDQVLVTSSTVLSLLSYGAVMSLPIGVALGVTNNVIEDPLGGFSLDKIVEEALYVLGVSPAPNDVLFGRGKTINDHPGNVILHRLAEERMHIYEMGSKWDKTVITSEIMAIIKEGGGRFLKTEGGSWVEVDDNVAREKVSHAFRSRRRIIAKATLEKINS